MELEVKSGFQLINLYITCLLMVFKVSKCIIQDTFDVEGTESLESGYCSRNLNKKWCWCELGWWHWD